MKKMMIGVVMVMALGCGRSSKYEACKGDADCAVCKTCKYCKWCKAHPDQPCGVMKKMKGEQ